MNIKFEFQPQVKTAFILKTFPKLIFPNLNRNIGIPSKLDTVLATDVGAPVGLICASTSSVQNTSRIIIFKVEETYQNAQIGSRMLQLLVDHLPQQGISEVFGFYRSHWKSVDPLNRILIKTGFESPQWYVSILSGSVHSFDNMYDGFEQIINKKFDLIPWKNLSELQHLTLKRYIKNKSISDILNPYQKHTSINQEISCVIFNKDQIVGWILAHIVSQNMLEYSSLFLHDNYRNYGNAISLMKYAIQNQRQKTNYKDFAATARMDNQVMHDFFRRLSENPGLRLIQTYKYYKRL